MKRIYSIIPSGEVEVAALVRAQNRARALSHYTARSLIVRVADQDDLIAATKSGIDVEDAADAEATEAATRG